MILFLDLETYNPVDKIQAGLYRYSEHAEIMLFAYAVDNNAVRVIDCSSGEKIPAEIFDNAEIIVAHNSAFDRVILEKYGFVRKNDPRWRDTMVLALSHGLPGGLGFLSDIFRLPIDKAKDKAGRDLISVFCSPRPNGYRETPATRPADWAKFVEYAALDVEAARELYKILPKWNASTFEISLWLLDQRINDRGFLVDGELAKSVLSALEKEKNIKGLSIYNLTDGNVFSTSQRDALIAYIAEFFGVSFPDLQKSTVERRLNDPELPDSLKEVLRARLLGSGTSTAKYKALLNSICSDGRLRGTLQFCGSSRTGRWSGRIFQPQNLPRPRHTVKQIEIAIPAFKEGCADLIFSDVSSVAASVLRSVIVAPAGRKLVISDFSSIEGRVLAWLAGEEYKIKNYAAGKDMYVETFARTFNRPPGSVTKDQRQLGKVLELALGYGGGVGAFVTFASGYGLDLDALASQTRPIVPAKFLSDAGDFYDALPLNGRHGLSRSSFVVCDAIKRLWRAANPRTVDFWSLCENAFKTVIRTPSESVQVNRIIFSKDGNWVKIKLPSGRYLCYAGAHVSDRGIVYRGVNSCTRKWEDILTYGGKIVENITQAVSRDVLADAMFRVEAAGYTIVLTVHDEIITEVPDISEYSHVSLSSLMSSPPQWAHGLPLSASGFESTYYRKD